jgi:heme/copper-type cytochrome/quinol oxidase subunit 1
VLEAAVDRLCRSVAGAGPVDQRVVVIIALGLALAIVASYLTSLGTRAGWYAYAPLTGRAFSPPGFGEPGWLGVIIWLAAISVWAAASATVLRPGHSVPE